MKAAVLTDWGVLEIKEVPTPAIGGKEALIRVAYTGICGSDVHSFLGRHPLSRRGMILGHEFSGTVAKINGETNVKPGDKVCAHITQHCGHCDLCRGGKQHLCKNLLVLGTQLDGTFAEYVKVPIGKLRKLPADSDLRTMALAEPLAVGVYAVKRARLELAQTVLVLGGGPIGLCCALASRRAGASRILVCELSEKRGKFLESFGFDTISPENAVEKAMRYSGDRGFDRVFETSGAKACSEMITKVGAFGGRGVIVALSGEAQPIDTWSMMRKEMDLAHMRVHTRDAYDAAVETMLDGPFAETMARLITHDFDFGEVQRAFGVCAANRELYCKIMVKIS
jgi:threonine dehydrogenase-like Zn-dependent dehydrogenase